MASMDTTLYDRLLASAFRFVSFRPRSEREIKTFLQNKLKRWNIAGNASVIKAINRLGEYGHVDDRKFALWWIDQRRTFRPKGIRAIKAELSQKGVSRALLDDVFSHESNDEERFDETQEAKKAIRKKIVLWAQMPIIEQKKKVYTFLAQRGFSSQTIENIIDWWVKKDYNK
jgi:regulatory protein